LDGFAAFFVSAEAGAAVGSLAAGFDDSDAWDASDEEEDAEGVDSLSEPPCALWPA
jgi:hypothetical protein